MTATDTHRAIEAVWRIESARLIAGLTRLVGDVGLAEDLAQDALLAALERWPESGVPDQPGAWLMATAKHRAIDQLRRRTMHERKEGQLGHELEAQHEASLPDLDAALDDPVGDDLLRLIFIACHPMLPTEARVALTLRLLGGLTTPEISRAFLVPEATIGPAHRARQADPGRGQSAVRGAARRGADGPAVVGARSDLSHLQRRLLGYRRRGLDAAVALRGGAAPGSNPRGARAGRAGSARARRADGDPGVPRSVPASAPRESRCCCWTRIGERWDQLLIRRGLAALERAEALGGALGAYGLQAAIAACHARARTAEETDWKRIAALYATLAG